MKKRASFEDLDPEIQSAIGEGLAQAERGDGRPWPEVREELRARFIKE
jgi:predicted transcriptional regulator